MREDPGSGAAPAAALKRKALPQLAQQQARRTQADLFATPQQSFQLTPTPAPVTIEARPAPQGAVAQLFQQQQPSIFAQQQPLPVELVSQPQPVAHEQTNAEAIAAMMAPSGWQTEINNPQIVQNVADQYNEKAKIGARDQLRMDREANSQTRNPVALSQQQWAALSPMQQAAVQANADLAQAVSRDIKLQSKNHATDEQFKKYQSRVKELFGEDAGTGVKGVEYAPNTIAFLDKRGLEAADLTGTNLDDLVLGDALIDTKTLQDIAEKVSAPPDVFHTWPTDPREKNIAFAQRLARGQLKLQKDLEAKMQKSKALLSDITGRVTATAASETYGAQDIPGHTALTAVRPEVAANLDVYLEALARTDSPLDKALAAIRTDLQERGASDEESAQVYAGLIDRTRRAMTNQGPWFDGIEFPMRSPDEVANALGAPTLKRDTTQAVK